MVRRAFLLGLALAACGGQIVDEHTATRTIGTFTGNADDRGTSSSGGGSRLVTTDGGAILPGCNGAAAAFTADFEHGALTDLFTVSSPGAFAIDGASPISGAQSLRVNPDPSSYITKKLEGVCEVKLGFSIRISADLFKTGSTLARINAGSRRFTIVLAPQGDLQLAEEIVTSDQAIEGKSAPFGTLGANANARIAFNADLDREVIAIGVGTPGGAPVALNTSFMRPLQDPTTPAPAIIGVDLGTTPGVDSDPAGLYWLDDITLE